MWFYFTICWFRRVHQQYKDDLIVIGLPCNQFGGQEPGAEKEIQQFCTKNFGVSFFND